MYEPKQLQYGLPISAGEYVPAHPRAYQPHPGYGDPTQLPDFDQHERFDPLKLFWYVVHYRWLLAALLTAGVVAGVLLTWLQTPLYRATANVEILTQGAKVIQELEVVSQVNDIRAFETAKLKLLSRDLSKRVVYELNLAEDEKFLAPRPTFSLFNLLDRITGKRAEIEIASLEQEAREKMATKLVQEGLSANLLRNASVLSVSFSHPDPESAAKIANQVVKSFIDQGVDKRSETSVLARQFIEERVAETKQKLQVSEQALVDYAKKEGITLNGNDASLIVDNIADINKALGEAIQERLGAERYLGQVQSGNANTLPEVFESESIQQSKQKIAELKATYQEKLATLKPGFPEMRRLSAQISEMQKQIALEVGAIAKSIEIKFEQTVQKEAALKSELAGLEARQAEFRDKNIQYTILKREVDSNRTQYESLIAKLNEVGVGAELRSTNASIVDEALAPNEPYSPRLLVNLLLSVGFFAVMAGALIYLLELMNNTFMVPDQIESELRLPVLGIIPRAEGIDIVEAFKDGKSSVSEAYRSLRTSLQFSGADGSVRTLIVTSSVPSEGKSTSAYKLAHDFAALGRNVLIIDADLRRPSLHRVFKTDNTIGLSNLLSNVVRQGDVISIFRRTADPNVTFLSAGTIPPNPAELLTSQKMAMTLHFCAKKYDIVIIDSPPVMGLSDALVLSRQCDATLLIVSSKQVTRKAAKNALARLKSAGGHVVGAALTKFAVNQLDYNYAYRYMQYNYYTYDSEQSRIEDYGDDRPKQTNTAGNPGRMAGAVSSLLGRLRGSSA